MVLSEMLKMRLAFDANLFADEKKSFDIIDYRSHGNN